MDRILDDDLLRPLGGAKQELVRLLLVPREAGLRAFELDQELVLAAGGSCREDERAHGATIEAQEQGRVVLERLGRERPELGQNLDDATSGHVLREVEPVGAQIPDDVRRA